MNHFQCPLAALSFVVGLTVIGILTCKVLSFLKLSKYSDEVQTSSTVHNHPVSSIMDPPNWGFDAIQVHDDLRAEACDPVDVGAFEDVGDTGHDVGEKPFALSGDLATSRCRNP